MAVYTHISEDQLAIFLQRYDIGALRSYEGIAAGVSNTNYKLETDQGRFVLTLFEPRRVRMADIPFFLNYAAHLSESGIPCPSPVVDEEGDIIGPLAGRPAVVVPFFEGEGRSFDSVSVKECEKAGEMAARMHVAGEGFRMRRKSDYGFERMEDWIREMGSRLDDISPGWQQAAQEELAWQRESWPQTLPHGAVHDDYFPDNVFFDESGEVCAVIDFHFACTEALAYDLAVTINAWCFSENEGVRFEQERYDALLAGYERVRPLSEEEKAALPVLLRRPALRTALARCEELIHHDPDDLMTPHDPLSYIKRLEHWQNER